MEQDTSSPAVSSIGSPATNPPAQTTNRAALGIVFLVVFIDLLGFGIVLPLLPRFGDELLERDLKTGAAVGGMILGLLMSSFSLMQFLFAPMWGQLSDRIGRRPVLLVGLAGSVVFYLLFGVALHLSGTEPQLALVLLFVARLGAGGAGATIGTAQAVIADSTPPEKRKHGMALIGAAFGIGFTFGPLVGFAALAWFKEVPGAIGYSAAALSLVALGLAVWKLPETRRFSSGPKIDLGTNGPALASGNQKLEVPQVKKRFDLLALRNTLRDPVVGTLVLIFFLATFGFGSFEATLSLLNKDILKVGDENNFLVFAYVGFVLLMTQGFLYRRLAKRLSELTFMTIGIGLMGLGVASLGAVAWSNWAGMAMSFGVLLTIFLVSLTVSVMGFSFLTPSIQALISRLSDPERQGEILGANQSASALARILGPFVGLSLYKAEPSHLLPYALGAGLLLLMLPLLPRVRRRTAAPSQLS